MNTRTTFIVTIVAAAASLLSACATQSDKSAPAAAPKPAAAPQAAAKPAAPARTAAQIAMNELLDDPKKQAIFQKYAPALATNPQISMARGMSLADVAGYAEAGLTAEMVKGIVDDINNL